MPSLGQPYKDPPHSANFGVGLEEKLNAVGIDYELKYTGTKDVKLPDMFGYLLEKLKMTKP